MDQNRLILVVEEDAAARAFLADNLRADGYRAMFADDNRHERRLPARHPRGDSGRPDLL
jgi:DNA-binding response OmpR family regulator